MGQCLCDVVPFGDQKQAVPVDSFEQEALPCCSVLNYLGLRGALIQAPASPTPALNPALIWCTPALNPGTYLEHPGT